jgi:glycogen debranching enzyme
MSERLGRDATDLRSRYEATKRAFQQRFPATTGWLYDVMDAPGAAPDPALRPNQVLAYSLPYAPMLPDPAPLRTLAGALLTPVGLRSLAPDEPGYRPTHRGSPADRDHAYHQGTVWPWLIGPYADACHRAGVPVGELTCGFRAHLGEWGLGSVTETADGQPPHAATGCPFQAWSVAEVLRATRFD